MKDFDFFDDSLWCVVKEDGKFAGSPCLAYEEAAELAAQHLGSCIFKLVPEYVREDVELDWENDEPDWGDGCDLERGFDPYLGCYTDDC